MPTKEQCGHTSDCKMEGCQSIPACGFKLRDRVDLAINELIVTKQLQAALDVLHLVQREWAPGTKKKRVCDPYTVSTAALQKIDEYEEMKP